MNHRLSSFYCLLFLRTLRVECYLLRLSIGCVRPFVARLTHSPLNGLSAAYTTRIYTMCSTANHNATSATDVQVELPPVAHPSTATSGKLQTKKTGIAKKTPKKASQSKISFESAAEKPKPWATLPKLGALYFQYLIACSRPQRRQKRCIRGSRQGMRTIRATFWCARIDCRRPGVRCYKFL